MEKEDCQLGPMSCQKKKKMRIGCPWGGEGLTALCLYAKTLHNSESQDKKYGWMLSDQTFWKFPNIFRNF